MADRFEEARMLLRLAERDKLVFGILAEHPRAPLGNTMFNAQQAVEKALKAALSASSIVFPPSHNLTLLADLATAAGLALPVPMADLKRLNPFAVTFRYDDTEIETLTRTEATVIVDAVLTWATALIPSEPQP